MKRRLLIERPPKIPYEPFTNRPRPPPRPPALPAGHPLADSGEVRLAQLTDADWISGGPRPEGTLLDAALRQGFRPRVAHVVAEWTAEQGYVAAGLGVALVPAPAAAGVRQDVALVPVRDEGAPARAVYAATARGRSLSPAGQAFVAVLREAARSLLPAWSTPRPARVPQRRGTVGDAGLRG
ncbi:LysR substrate-binding domain-containing protein [Streptomyces sp. NPDC006654]|uniref:LysR substrate-binding domain-containing protein n=1 Tax=Streptomyces sp. NPDC006654 TaxID=3156897 RepID=UPI0033E6DC27